MERVKFQKVILIGRTGTQGVPQTLLALYDCLLQLNVQIGVEQETATMLSDIPDLVSVTPSDFSDYELIIVVGGDGSLLNAAHLAVSAKLPVLGINRGLLGFLTDIHPDELDKVIAVLEGSYQEEQRFLLNMELWHEDERIAEGIALNDVVLLPGHLAHMIEFSIHINNQFMCKQRADGMIVATPTGSTAYALSGGGPILHPKLDAVVLVPMFPHTLSSRPIVIDGNSSIDIDIVSGSSSLPNVSLDGQQRIAVPPGGRIQIRKKNIPLRLIHPIDYNYFTTLREKLKWASQAERQ